MPDNHLLTFEVHTEGLQLSFFSLKEITHLNAQNVAISQEALVCLGIIHEVLVFVVVLQCKQLGLALGDLERE